MTADRPLKVLLAYRSDVDVDGGAGHVMRGTAEGLRSLGVQVEVSHDLKPDLTPGYDLVHTFNIWWPHTALEQMRYVRAQGVPLVWQPIYLRQSEYVWANLASRAVLSGERPPAERAQLLEAFTAGSLRVNNLGRWEPNEAFPKLFQYLREMAQLADHVCVCSVHEAQAIFQDGKLTSKPFSVIPHGVDQQVFGSASPDAFRAWIGTQDEFVLCVASVDGRKNQLFLAEALREVGLNLVLVGPCYEPGYLDLVRQRGGKGLSYVERLPQALVASALAAARVHALPSYAEGSALASMEAATAGCPVVVSNRSSEFEYYGDLAFYCDPADPVSIRTAVLDAWRSRAEQPARLERLQRRMRHFTWEAAGRATLAAYQRTLADVRRRGLAERRRAAGIADARAFACLVDYTELTNRPELLSLWSEAFGSGDPATLVVYAPGVAPNELEQRLRPLVEQVEGSSGRQLDLVAVAPPSPVDGAVARGVDAVLSPGGLSDVFASLPSAHGEEARHLRAIGERTWRSLEEAA